MDGYRQRVAGKDGQRKEGRFWKRLKIKNIVNQRDIGFYPLFDAFDGCKRLLNIFMMHTVWPQLTCSVSYFPLFIKLLFSIL